MHHAFYVEKIHVDRWKFWWALLIGPDLIFLTLWSQLYKIWMNLVLIVIGNILNPEENRRGIHCSMEIPSCHQVHPAVTPITYFTHSKDPCISFQLSSSIKIMWQLHSTHFICTNWKHLPVVEPYITGIMGLYHGTQEPRAGGGWLWCNMHSTLVATSPRNAVQDGGAPEVVKVGRAYFIIFTSRPAYVPASIMNSYIPFHPQQWDLWSLWCYISA